MAGRRHKMDSLGSSYQDSAKLLLGRIASLIRVPSEQDFGIDYYCELRSPLRTQSETVGALFSIQVKGGNEVPQYGGVDKKGTWRQYQITWLKSLANPFYLAKVDKKLFIDFVVFSLACLVDFLAAILGPV